MDSDASTRLAREGLPLEKIVAAWEILRPALWPTHLLRCAALDEISGFRVWLKPENLQRTGSYKIRGAYYKLHRLKETQGTRKVIAASAGNHAQGVAYAAKQLGMDCVIVMPEQAPLPKRRATMSYGAKVLLEGSCFDDSLAFAIQYAPSEGREFISPYNDADVIAGQGTVALEMLEEMKEDPPDAVVVPVGGGGLISGVAAVLKQKLPQCRLIAVQSSCAPAFVRSWQAYHANALKSDPLVVPTQETIADGVRVRQPGEICWALTKDAVDAAMTLDDPQVYGGILMLLEHAKLVAEGAGALSVAALLDPAARKQMEDVGIGPGARVVALVTGGNIDTLTLQRVMGRSLAVTGRERTLDLRVKDEPGQLDRILDFLRKRRVKVLDLSRTARSEFSASQWTDIELLIETEDEIHGQEVLQDLADEAKKRNFELLLQDLGKKAGKLDQGPPRPGKV